VSELLDKARQQAEAADYKKAVKTLERLEWQSSRSDVSDARGLLELAIAIKDKEPKLQKSCDWLIRQAGQNIERLEKAPVH
jgi:hypothetical protein